MSGGEKGPVFAPIPVRALTDRRLLGRHLHTLAVIAAHDRFGKNGIGCWASHKRLAEFVGCNYSRLSTNLRELAEYGYIEQSPHPMNKRLRVYKVLYTPEDAAVMKGVSTENPLPTGKQSSPDSLPAGEAEPPNSLPRRTGSLNGTKDLASQIYSPEGEKIFRRSEERDSVETAPSNDGAILARFERAFRANKIASKDLPGWHRWLTELHETSEYGSPQFGCAYRLADEVYGLLDESGAAPC